MNIMRWILTAGCALTLLGCANSVSSPGETPVSAADYMPVAYVQTTPPEWARDAVIYQINTRHFTPEGTFKAAQSHLPRLQALGVDILWLMPIHPIGEVNRKGSLGSPYAVQDFRGVNPEFGTLDDLRAFVEAAHALDMHVILDWVANHTAWDNPMVESHPHYYARNWKGEMHPPLWTDWADVVELDYSQPGLRQYMTEAMAYWVRDVGIDGFRCDVAGYVPLDFWERLRVELDAIKPVFMLAEWETRDMHRAAFDATYAWGWKEALQPIAKGESTIGALRGYYSGQQNTWPDAAYRMVYTSNHDQNAWDGAAPEIYGHALEAAIVLSFVSEGIPTIYNGQESGLDRRLAFFDKDEIAWADHPHAGLFSRLTNLKQTTQALWNGADGARLIEVPTNAPDHVFSFVRFGDKDGVFAAFNFSGVPRPVKFGDGPHQNTYTDVFTSDEITISDETVMILPAWGYRVLRRDFN